MDTSKHEAAVRERLEPGEQFIAGPMTRSGAASRAAAFKPGGRAESIQYVALTSSRVLIVSRYRRRFRSIERGSLTYQSVSHYVDKLGRPQVTITRPGSRFGVRFAFSKKDADTARAVATALMAG